MKKITMGMIGRKSGKLTVVKMSENQETNKEIMWTCICECGNYVDVAGSLIRTYKTKSCGCSNRMKSLVGNKFGHLTVIEQALKLGGRAAYRCICDCGNTTVVQATNLKSGNTKSCGCQIAKGHGIQKRIYDVWFTMMRRCYSVDHLSYKYYGARGIEVCKEWRGNDGAENFAKWAYANGYDENAKQGKCTLDRINNDGNYEPSNCRWVDMKTQASNKRNSKNSIKATAGMGK